MNSMHDLGGMHGFGPVAIERDEPVFHATWEGRTLALQRATGYLGKWNIDMSRHSREKMPPLEYLAASYYERWLWGLEKMVVEKGLVTEHELRTGHASGKTEGARVLRAADVLKFLSARRSGRQDVAVAARFQPGDAVRARNSHPLGHTRIPRYVRGKHGVIDRDHGVFIFPDTHSVNWEKRPQHCFSVRFDARVLWGPAAAARDRVYLDLWDEYLDPA